MKHYSFQQQTLVSFCLLMAAAVVAAITHLGLIGRIAFFAVGTAYVIRAVPPVIWSIQLGEAKAKLVTRILGLSFILYSIFAHF
ncbi:hypothetical protein D1646_05290 [Pseudoflavonifractor sp. 60]|uniref:hypothetical protein n=1 Tax=Pseudoflavonifractor sp. 60 TaxID=2304576 RepID=UPI00136FEC92|nr:hypothetical protein [Pseudoflavonifractor sp. 60]NBI66237.1 hypothetical protein [Pseudoflavonifractor sp. 60]